MKHVINNIAKHTANRLAMLLMFVLGITSYASADNVLSVENLNVAVGHEDELQFTFDNETPVTAMTLDFTLPNGLELVTDNNTGKFITVKNPKISQSLKVSSVTTAGGAYYRAGFFGLSLTGFPAHIGKLFTIKVKCKAALDAKDRQVKIINQEVTDAAANILPVKIDDSKGMITVTSTFSGTMNVSAANPSFSILPGNTYKLGIQVENSEALTGFQGTLTLPAGLTVVADENGNLITKDPTRAPGDDVVTTYSAKSGIMFMTIPGGCVGASGPLFYVNVKADNSLAANSKINFNQIHFTTVSGGYTDFTTTQAIEVAVKNAMPDEYAAAKKVVEDLKASLETAKTSINTDCKDVAAQYTDKVNDISNQIGTLSGNVESVHTDGTLRIENVNVSAKLISHAIATMLSDAKAAQKKFTDDAAAAKKAANDAAYKTLSDQIAATQKKLDDAKATIATNCKDVAAQYTETATGLQTQITALKTDLDAKNAKQELNAESTVNTADVDAAIAKMLTDAQAAQKKFNEAAADAAKKAANDAAYKTLTAQLNDVQAKLDAAKNTLKTSYPDVAASFNETVASIQSKIDAIKTQLDIDNTNIKLTADSKINTSEIEVSIYQLLADAAAAQKDYAAKKAANDAAYKALSAQIAATQAKLDAANATIAKDCKDVAAQFTETATGLQTQITALKTDLDAKNAKLALTAESTVNTADIDAAIAKMLTDAQSAQKKVTDDAAAAKKAANDAAYTKLAAQIAATQAKLDAANATIAKDCKDVAAQCTETAKGLQIQITALKTDLDAKNAKMELNATSTVNTADVETAIAKMLTDAQAAQKKFNDDADAAAKKAANDAAYTKLAAQIAATPAQLDAANAAIAKDCKDVAAQFAENAKGLQTQITALKTDLDAKNAKTELNATSTVNTADIETAIAKMLTDAQAAQKKYEAEAAENAKKAANDAAYKTLSAQITDVQAKLDAAIKRINSNYPNVADDFKK